MQAYRFETKISKDGNIQIPSYNHLIDKDVEVIILSKSVSKTKRNGVVKFLNKWSGFLKSPDTDIEIEDAKYQYISEKYK
jgi:hypothetical protein